MKRLVVYVLCVLATVAAVLLLWQFRSIVGLFLLSLATAATLRPVVERHRWLPRNQAVLVTYAITLAVGLGVAAIVGNWLLADLHQASDNLLVIYDRAWTQWPTGTPLQQRLAAWLPPPNTLYETLAGEQGAAILTGMLGVTLGLFDALANVAIVLILSLYWSLDQTRFERLWLSLLPTGQRAQAREMWRTLETGVGAYLRSELAQSLLAGVLLGAGYWLLGVQYPTLLAVGGALAWLIPWLGALLAVAPVVLAGTLGLGGSLWLGLGAGLYTLAILLMMEFLVEPRLIKRRHSSLLVVLLALGLGQVWGLAGVLAAPPLAVALQILFGQLVPQAASAGAGQVAAQMAELEERLRAIRADVEAAGEAAMPETMSLLERLGRLVAEAHPPAANAAPSDEPAAATPAKTDPSPAA